MHLFTDSHSVKSGVKLASDATAEVTAKGDVIITTSNGRTDKSFLLQNTLHVPNLRTNLLSVSKIVDKDYTVVFTKNHAHVKDKNGTLKITANREGDLFLIRTEPVDSASAVSDVKSDETEWHIRLLGSFKSK